MFKSGRVGIRTDIRLWVTPFPSGEYATWCDFYGCFVSEGTEWVTQGTARRRPRLRLLTGADDRRAPTWISQTLPGSRSACARPAQDGVPWRKWGPYLSERQWGTVREDYSANGDAWNSFPHDHARSRAYRWGEDGIAGFCDDRMRLCFALALWNGRDPILKERLFGLTNSEGNHGEDVKEYYFYLDATPTSSYLKLLYKYPQDPFPYDDLVRVNGARSRQEMEYELLDTGLFDRDRYFDVFVEYAKAAPEEVLIRISVVNRGPETAELRVLPHLWFRNTWWQSPDEPRPWLEQGPPGGAREPSSASTPTWAPSTWCATARASCCSPATRPTKPASPDARTPPPTSRTASTTTSWAASARRSIPPAEAPRPRPITRSRSGRGRPRWSACC